MQLICLLNNLPIILVGPPGSSKTLSKRIIYDAMKGRDSKCDYFKKFPRLIIKTY